MSNIQAVTVNHNTSKYVELMLRSLNAFNISGLKIDITIMDNASDDDGLTDLQAYAKVCGIPICQSGFTTKSELNSHGEVLSRYVLSHEKADYYLFLDADICFIQPDTINMMLDLLKSNNHLFAVGTRQTWDADAEIPDDHRQGVYYDRLHPACALIKNSEIFQKVIESIGMTGIKYCFTQGEVYWDTCKLMTKTMATHGLGYEICDAMVQHFFGVSYNSEWKTHKEALRDKLLLQYK